MPWVRRLERTEFAAAVRGARLVVAHAGVGSVVTARRASARRSWCCRGGGPRRAHLRPPGRDRRTGCAASPASTWPMPRPTSPACIAEAIAGGSGRRGDRRDRRSGLHRPHPRLHRRRGRNRRQRPAVGRGRSAPMSIKAICLALRPAGRFRARARQAGSLCERQRGCPARARAAPGGDRDQGGRTRRAPHPSRGSCGWRVRHGCRGPLRHRGHDRRQAARAWPLRSSGRAPAIGISNSSSTT